MSDSETHARLFLEGVGCNVERITALKKQKRADFLARFRSENYIVEAKERQTTKDAKKMVQRAIDESTASLAREPRIWGIFEFVITHSNEQLKATPAPEGAFLICFVSCVNLDSRFQSRTISRYLYGSATLNTFTAGGVPSGTKECLYWNPSGFRLLSHTDAVVIGRDDGFRLFVNPFTSRIAAFRKSQMYSWFLSKRAVTDPDKMETEGHCISLDPVLDFAIPDSKQTNIRDRYGYNVAEGLDFHFQAVAVL